MTSEFLALVGNLTMPGAAILAALYLARELRAMTTRLIETLTSTIDRNTQILAHVQEVLEACKTRNRG